MKILFTLIAALALTLTVHGQATTNVLSEVTINVNSSTNLNVSTLRLTIQSCTFDAQTWVPTITYLIEASADDVENGVTNRMITAKKTLTLTPNQLKALLNAPDPRSAFTTAILAKAKLTPR